MSGPNRKIMAVLAMLGFSTMLTQLVLIRELLNVFQGNELIIGLILFNWMLLTAAGSKLGQRIAISGNEVHLVSRIFVISGVGPVIMVLLLYLFDALAFPPGTAKGVSIMMLYSVGLLLPGCLVSGFLYTRLAALLSGYKNRNCVSEAYGWESLGSLAAGILFGAALAFLFNSMQILAVVMLCNAFAAWWWTNPPNQLSGKIYFQAISWLLLSIMLFAFPVDQWLASFQHRNQHIRFLKDTPWGKLLVTETQGQHNYFENGVLLFSTENQYFSEEAVHYALLQRSNPKKVMVVSGGITAMAEQVLKYPSVNRLDYVDINPWLVKAERSFSGIPDAPVLQVKLTDARKLISHSKELYDVILINAPDPMSAQINRYFTLEFFQSANKTLQANGVLSVGLSPTVNYMGTQAQEVNRIVYHTLKRVFNHVVIIPGERNYFLASDDSIGLDMANRVQQAGIENDYVNAYAMDDALLAERSRQIMEMIALPDSSVNTDFTPLAYLLQIKYWLGMVEGRKTMFTFVLIIIMLVLVFMISAKSLRPITTGVFTAGFAGASAEFLILIVYQIVFGNIYQMLGVIVALYMAGLAAGAFFRFQGREKARWRLYLIAQCTIMPAVLIIPVIAASAATGHAIPDWIILVSLLLTTFIIALLGGLSFNLASGRDHLHVEQTAGNLYAIDLTGSALGSLLVSVVCFPLLGLWLTCIFVAGFVGLGIMVILILAKH